MITRNRPASAGSFLLLLLMSVAACAALEEQPVTEPMTSGSSILMLEHGNPCMPSELRRMDSSGAIDHPGIADGRSPLLAPESPGTWLYLGDSGEGTVMAIVQNGPATPLPEGSFETVLEIRPKTHPVDLRPSTNPGARNASFSFAVLSNGKPVKRPVRYTASRLGRLSDPKTASSLAVTSKDTIMGSGRIQIDEPGIWWITAEQGEDGEEKLCASITFIVPEGPGSDHYSAFTRAGGMLDGPDAIAAHLDGMEVIFIGEKHDDPVAHLLERQILEAVHERTGKTALSMEMFERDVQPVMDGYLKGIYPEKHFLGASRPWPRYATDYRPMVEYAKDKGLQVITANAPRRMVNLVSRKGPDALSTLPDKERQWLPPLPYDIPEEGRYVEKLHALFTGFASEQKSAAPPAVPRRKRDWKAKGCPDLEKYNEMLAAAPEGGSKPPSGGMPGHAMMKLAEMKGGNPGQSLWDAAMAYSIAEFLESHPGTTVVQVNGSFHSDEYLGTVEQLMRYRPGTRIGVVSILPDPLFPAFDGKAHGELGEVIIITDPTWQPE